MAYSQSCWYPRSRQSASVAHSRLNVDSEVWMRHCPLSRSSPAAEFGSNSELMVSHTDRVSGPDSRLRQCTQLSKYLKSSKNVYKDGIRPSTFFIRAHMACRSSSLNSTNAWPLMTSPHAVFASDRDLPGANNCRAPTVSGSIRFVECRSDPTKEVHTSRMCSR